MKTFFILGDSGFIGSAFFEHLASRNERVIGINRKTVRDFKDGVVTCNSRKTRDIFSEIEKNLTSNSAVINAMWGKNDRLNRNSLVHEECAFQEMLLIKQLANSKITYVSFGSIAEIKDEQISPSKDTEYANNKKRVYEHLSSSDLQFLWLRIASCYGPGDSREWLITQLRTAWENNEELRLENPNQQLNLCYIDSLITATVQLLKTNQIGTFNITTKQWLTVSEIENCFKNLMEPQYLNRTSGPFSPTDSESLMVSTPPISKYFESIKRSYSS